MHTTLAPGAPLLLALLAACAAAPPAGAGDVPPCAPFLVRPGAPEGAVTGEEGALRVQEVAEGDGPAAAPGDRVLVHYTGYLGETLEPFGTSCAGGEPLAVRLGEGRMVPGFEQGLEGMREGGVRRLLVPAALGYGAAGRGPIPPGADLVFDVHLLRVEGR